MTSRNKKICCFIVFGMAVFVLINAFFNDGIESHYNFSNGKCITVWKKTNGEVYVISGKHEGNENPVESYIITTNKQFLTLYFSKALKNRIIVKDEGNLESNKKGYIIKNKTNGKWEFLEYSDNYKPLLYQQNAAKFIDVRSTTDLISINIEENYATNKNGKRLQ